MSKMTMNLCQVHQEEPCGPSCGATCQSSWHNRVARRTINNAPLCGECAQEFMRMEGCDRAAATKYDYACGYGD